MSLREPCANVTKGVKCGHEKESHHAERVSSPDGIPRTIYHGCLCAFCECTRFKSEASNAR